MKNLNNKSKNQKVVYTIFGVIFIAACVFLTIECATNGAEMNNLISYQDILSKDKKELTARLVELSSLNKIQDKALVYGFSKPQKVVYIQSTDEFASLLP